MKTIDKNILKEMMFSEYTETDPLTGEVVEKMRWLGFVSFGASLNIKAYQSSTGWKLESIQTYSKSGDEIVAKYMSGKTLEEVLAYLNQRFGL